MASLYLDKILIETDLGDCTVWTLIRVIDEDDKASLEKHYTYRGEIGIIIEDGVICSEVSMNVIEEIV